MIERLFKELDKKHVRYAILHGWQMLPGKVSSDIDIIIEPHDLGALVEVLANNEAWKLVQTIQHEKTCFYFVIAVVQPEGYCFVPLDVATDYRIDGRKYFTAKEMLSGRWKWKEYWVVSARVEFVYLVVKKILKGEISEAQKERLLLLWQELGQEGGASVRRLLGQEWGPKFESWLVSGDLDSVYTHFPQLQRAIKAHVSRCGYLDVLKSWGGELSRCVSRVLIPTGLVVVLLGPDGSGKSTVLARLEHDLSRAFRRTRRYHLRPSVVWSRRSKGESVIDPHGKAPRSAPSSLAKLMVFWLDYCFGYWVDIYPRLVRSTLVLFDRYYDDILVDPKRYRFTGPMWLAGWVSRLIPRADIVIVLDAPAEVIRGRKQEVELEEIVRQRRAYLDLADTLPNAFVVNASNPVDAVVAEATRIILSYMTERVVARPPLQPAEIAS